MFYYHKDMDIWIVVLVESGIPMDVEIFSDEGFAEENARERRLRINAENDEVGFFYKMIPTESSNP